MALSQEQLTKLKARLVVSPEPVTTEAVASLNTGFAQSIKDSFSSRVGKAQEAQNKVIEGKQSALGGTLQTIGQGAGFVGDVAGKAIDTATFGLIPKAMEQTSKLVPSFISNLGADAIQKYESLKQSNPEAFANLEAITNIATAVPVGIGTKTGVTTGAKLADKAIDSTVNTTKNTISNIARITKPIVTEEKALGQVLQGTTKAVEAGEKAIKAVDTTKVKTFADLDKVLSNKVGELSKVVDTELAKDTGLYKIADLAIEKPTAMGAVKINYVDNALKQLDELYGTTGDVVEQANIKALMNKANTDGLSRLEVNNIARNYGAEFGSKAFSKLDEPLTSVNAQLYENTRTGLKETARQGITGAGAKSADKSMSSILNTQTLIKKNIEAVNKLKNKIDERGLLEKVGYGITKYADILTGGTVRGLVGGLLPRGAGYKTLNALDLEALLERNLKIIRDAGKAKTTTQFKSKINELFDSKVVDTDKAVKGFIEDNKK